MADSREMRQQELARLLLQKARQDLALVMSVANSNAVADEIIGFHIQQGFDRSAGLTLAEKFVEWANSIIELPVRPSPQPNDDNHPAG